MNKLKLPDCGDNSCSYAVKRTGMRTNGGCRCDNCPECGGYIKPGRWQQHRDWCTQRYWIPDHYKPEFFRELLRIAAKVVAE